MCGMQQDDIGTVPGSCGLPLPGFDMVVLDSKGEPLPTGQMGSIAILSSLTLYFTPTHTPIPTLAPTPTPTHTHALPTLTYAKPSIYLETQA